jgi:hypothetical protein
MRHFCANLSRGAALSDADNARGFRWRRGVNRSLLFLPLWTILLAGHLAAGTVGYQVSGLGGNAYRYEFFPSNLNLLIDQELDIQFDPTFFGSLFNGVADSDFRLLLLQPNNPPGAVGDYTALALVDNPSLAGPFSVDVRWFGSGVPGGLPYLLHQFDASGQNLGTIGSGSLVVETPEPASWLLGGIGLVIGGFLGKGRRRL